MPTAIPLALPPRVLHVVRRPGVRVGAIVFGSAVLVWGVVGGRVFANAPVIVPLYPTTQSPVEVTDVSEFSVAQVVEHLTIINRFEMMLYNGGALHELDGEGPYTVFAPADNYFDYVPKAAFLGLHTSERAILAREHIVPRRVIPLDESANGTYLTLGGTQLSFEARAGDHSAAVGPPASGGFVIKAYKAKNGVVYIVSRLLVPESLTALQTPRALSVAPSVR